MVVIDKNLLIDKNVFNFINKYDIISNKGERKMIEYNINMRKEIFGSTLLNLKNGQREYFDTNETKKVLEEGIFPIDSSIRSLKEKPMIKFNENNNIQNHFSFADIAYIEITHECNLRCKHCLNNSGNKLPNQLTDEEIFNLIIEFSKAGMQEIRFTGGEPLVHKKIYDFITLAHQLGLYTSIGTNGTLVTKSVSEKLKLAGLNKAVVSIDGTEKAHDSIRGKGNYKRAIEGIENLEASGIKVRINAVIMKSNMEDVIKLAKQLNENKKHLMIRRFIESGRGSLLENNTLSKQDYDYVRNQLKEELKGEYIIGHYLNENEQITYRLKLPFDFTKGCKAGQRALIILPNGDISLCGFLAAQGFSPIGNIRDVSNWLIFWNDMHSENYLKELRNNLARYNSIPNVQPTNCLAYVQRMLTFEKNKKEKNND